jgi:uncharacterized 2Fe-2S/4Fe-4S cluster protein (DUF4445 family)
MKGQAAHSACPFFREKCGGCGACTRRSVLTDYTPVRPSMPYRGGGKGLAVDIGTTTLAAELLDMETGERLAVASRMNSQMRYSADVIRRIEYAIGGGEGELRSLLLEDVRQLAEGFSDITHAVIVGNTVMMHMLQNWPVDGLASWPFTPHSLGGGYVEGILDIPVLIPRGAGTFFGSDAVAALVHCGHGLMLDMGTNAEIGLYAGDDNVLVTSAAAGTAFSSDPRLALAAIRAAVEIVQTQGGKAEKIFAAGGIGVAYGYPGATPVGNAALGGAAAILLSSQAEAEAEKIARVAKVVDMAGCADFAEIYMKYVV